MHGETGLHAATPAEAREALLTLVDDARFTLTTPFAVDGSADGRMRHPRRIGPLAAFVHIRKIEPQRGDVSLRESFRQCGQGCILARGGDFLLLRLGYMGQGAVFEQSAVLVTRNAESQSDAASLAAYLHSLDPPVRLLGIDNLPGSLHLETMELPRRVCFLFGQEGPGLSEAAREVCDGTFSIAQFGSTRSINASSAAAIAMHSWVRTYADLTGDDAWRG